jgi:hypothetical protein
LLSLAPKQAGGEKECVRRKNGKKKMMKKKNGKKKNGKNLDSARFFAISFFT